MSNSLQHKLTLAFILEAVLSIVLAATLLQLASTYQLEQMIIKQERSRLERILMRFYSHNHSWQGISGQWEQLHHQASLVSDEADSQTHPNLPPDNFGEDDFFGIADAQGVVLVPVDMSYPQGAKLPEEMLQTGTPLFVEGKRAGTILYSNRILIPDSLQSIYRQRIFTGLMFVIYAALFLVSLFGTRMARSLITPIDALIEAARNITRGNFAQHVVVKNKDEIGQLAEAFNLMSQEIARINQSRQEMIADIAHELGSPLSVISGYVEGFEDGTLTPSRERLRLIRAEIEQLQCLVGDLRILSLANGGALPLDLQWMDPRKLISETAALFKQSARERNIHLVMDVQKDLPVIQIDRERMLQILGNLVNNSLRYTPSNGKIILSAKRLDDRVAICVKDTGIGINPEELPFIFDRFYRVNNSRTDDGHSGLGLAIVKVLAELQGGSVVAESTAGSGTSIRILIPC